jgi:von Willebrand factor type A domain
MQTFYYASKLHSTGICFSCKNSAEFWILHFIVGSASTSKICSCKSVTDLVFVIDPTASDFVKLRDFVISVINWFDVGQNLTRVGVVSIDQITPKFINLNQYYDRLSLYAAVNAIAANRGSSR